MKIKKGLAFASIVFSVVAVGFNTENVAHASNTPWKTIKTKKYSHTKRYIFHFKKQTRNVYGWNYAHTKKVKVIKSNSNTTLYLDYSRIIQKGTKKMVVYKVYDAKSNTNYNIWRGYLVKGHYPDYATYNGIFVNDVSNISEYQSYIDQSPSQKLTRKLIALFPNTKLSYGLSSLSQFNDGVYMTSKYSIGDNKTSVVNQDFSKINEMPQIAKYLSNNQLTDSEKYDKIVSWLNANGYNAEQRKNMKNYEIGIFYNRNKSNYDGTENLAYGNLFIGTPVK